LLTVRSIGRTALLKIYNSSFYNDLEFVPSITLSTVVDGYVSICVDRLGTRARRIQTVAMTDFENEDWTEEEIETQFPLGDGTAETEAIVYCPHCGEANEVALDPGSGDDQEYVEDCQVCCRPWLMYVKYGKDGAAEVEVYASDS
jgi:hypothetical protein